MSLLPRPITLPSNAQLSALLDGVDEVLVLVDARQRVSFRNQAAHRLLGCEPGQGLDALLAWFAEPARLALRRAFDASAGPLQAMPLRLAQGPLAGHTLALSLSRGAAMRGCCGRPAHRRRR